MAQLSDYEREMQRILLASANDLNSAVNDLNSAANHLTSINNHNNCQGTWVRGKFKGQRCSNPKISGSQYCSYHKKYYRKKNLPKIDNNVQNVQEKISCTVCYNDLEGFSKIMLGCNHNFHFRCFMILMEDEHGFVYNSNKCPVCNHSVKEEMERTCCICMDDIMSNSHTTKCNHSFHKECLNEWKNINNSCPMCRESL